MHFKVSYENTVIKSGDITLSDTAVFADSASVRSLSVVYI